MGLSVYGDRVLSELPSWLSNCALDARKRKRKKDVTKKKHTHTAARSKREGGEMKDRDQSSYER